MLQCLEPQPPAIAARMILRTFLRRHFLEFMRDPSVAVFFIPVAAGLFRDRPEKFGPSTDAGLPAVQRQFREEPSFTRDQALRAGVFWLLTATAFFTNAIGTAIETLWIMLKSPDVAGRAKRPRSSRCRESRGVKSEENASGSGVNFERARR